MAVLEQVIVAQTQQQQLVVYQVVEAEAQQQRQAPLPPVQEVTVELL
jgi:hypothetical protein